MNKLNRRVLPSYVQLFPDLDYSRFKNAAIEILRLAEKNDELVQLKKGRSSGVFCTYCDENKVIDKKSAFITTKRYENQPGKWKVTNKLVRSHKFKENQINSNTFKDFIPKDSYFKRCLSGWGDLRKVDFSILEPNGWLPAHIDFNASQGLRVIIPISTNPECFNVTYNKFTKQFDIQNFKEGEVWLNNAGLLHNGVNFGSSQRIFVLATYADQGILKYAKNI